MLASGLPFEVVIGSLPWSKPGYGDLNLEDMRHIGAATFALSQYARSLVGVLVAKKACAHSHRDTCTYPSSVAAPVSSVSEGQLQNIAVRQHSLRKQAIRVVATHLHPPPEHQGRAAFRIFISHEHGDSGIGQSIRSSVEVRAATMYACFVSQLLFLVRTMVLRRQWENIFQAPLRVHQQQLFHVQWGWDVYNDAAADLIRSFACLKYSAKKYSWPSLKEVATLVGIVGSFLL
jgi:hypothetical protein